MRHCIYILINRALRSLNLSSLDSSLELILGWLHEWRVECATYLEHKCTLSTSSLQALASLFDSLYVTTDNQLTWAVIVGRYYHTLAQLANLGTNLLYLLVGQSDDGCHS